MTLAGLAGLVGEGTDNLGSHFGPGATGVLQSALGNLPELFISLFALREGLVVLTQTALIGSILGNSLLVLGLAFLAGGLKHGRQVFDAAPVRTIAISLVLAVAALAIPTVSTAPGGAGQRATPSRSRCSCRSCCWSCSWPRSRTRSGAARARRRSARRSSDAWPLKLAIGVLAGAGLAAAVVADWFVEALQPAMATLGLSEAFVGLVVVALAGNAVENVVGIQQAMRNRTRPRDQPDPELEPPGRARPDARCWCWPACSSRPVPMTLVLTPTLLVGLALTAILGALVVFDGESNWLEGLMLLGLYAIIAASVWYGPPLTRLGGTDPGSRHARGSRAGLRVHSGRWTSTSSGLPPPPRSARRSTPRSIPRSGAPRSGWDGGQRDTAADGHVVARRPRGAGPARPAAAGARGGRGARSAGSAAARSTTSRSRLAVPPAEAYGVASFYALLPTTPRPPIVAHVCDDIACRLAGAERICEELEARLGPAGRDRRPRATRPGSAARAWGSASERPAVLVTSAGPTPRVARPRRPPRRRRRRRACSRRCACPRSSTTDVVDAGELAPQAGDRPRRLLARVGRVDPTSLDAYRAIRRLRGAARGAARWARAP